LYALDAALAADLTKRFFLYLPDLGIGVSIFVGGILASRVIGRRALIGSVNRGLPAARLLAALARGGIVVLSSAIALDHVGIGHAILPSALLIILGGATLASALAIGLGSREAVSRWIDERLGHSVEPESDGIEHW